MSPAGHSSPFPTEIIAVEITTLTSGRQWRTFAKAHQAASWIAQHAPAADTSTQWFHLELFTPSHAPQVLDRDVHLAVQQACATAYASKTEFRRAITDAVNYTITATQESK